MGSWVHTFFTYIYIYTHYFCVCWLLVQASNGHLSLQRVHPPQQATSTSWGSQRMPTSMDWQAHCDLTWFCNLCPIIGYCEFWGAHLKEKNRCRTLSWGHEGSTDLTFQKIQHMVGSQQQAYETFYENTATLERRSLGAKCGDGLPHSLGSQWGSQKSKRSLVWWSQTLFCMFCSSC